MSGSRFMLVGLVAAWAAGAAAQGTTDASRKPGYRDPDLLCSCVWYTSTRCTCTAADACGHPRCEKNGNCQKCLEKLRQGKGTIQGRVKSPFTRLAKAVVYIKRVAGRKFQLPPRHPIMDQKNLIYVPHLLPILVGSTVDFPNSDKVRHNVFTPPSAVTRFNLGTYDVGVVKHVTFNKVGLVPLLCNVHAEMSAYIVVLQNPYFAITDRRGGFTIHHVPPGQYELTFWHEKLRPATRKVTVAAGQVAQVEFKRLKRK